MKFQGGQLVRSENGVIAGVCEGLGEKLDLSPNFLRLVWMILVLFFGVGFLLYFLLAVTIPKRNEVVEFNRKKVFGVCYNMSKKFEIDLGLIRFFALFSFITSFGSTLIVYLLMALLMSDSNEPEVLF